ncbi:MAG TPA: MBL fold metallo-hydrolase [Thermoanaerobaculia bacterium]|nr:MBL fold metallo-hydrolase [Thermoanaerobaculia bacterium]
MRGLWGLLLLLTPELLAAQPARLTATFIGNMAFAITDGKSTIYTDFPYDPGAFGYMTYDFAKVPKASPALCLITHGHRDHFDPALFARMDAKVIAPPDLEATLPRDRVVPDAPRMTFRDVVIEPIRTPHGTIDHRSYLVTWNGLRLYFTGDTDSTEALLAAKNLDVAFVSPWILGEVHEQGKRIDARRVIVYHHRPGETPPTFQNAVAPRQGEVLVLERPRS